jgi:hypothetical protein
METPISIGSKTGKKRRSSLFKNVKWGTFSNQLKNYNKHHTLKKLTLKEFANRIIKHPSKFHSKTIKRARMYNNIINPTKK